LKTRHRLAQRFDFLKDSGFTHTLAFDLLRHKPGFISCQHEQHAVRTDSQTVAVPFIFEFKRIGSFFPFSDSLASPAANQRNFEIHACRKSRPFELFNCSPEASCPRKWAQPTGLFITKLNLTFLLEAADQRAQLRKEGYGDG